MLIRILTEDKNLPAIKDLLTRYLSAFSIFRGEGCWAGMYEPSCCIEIETTMANHNDSLLTVRLMIAPEIKRLNHQEEVMMQVIQTETERI